MKLKIVEEDMYNYAFYVKRFFFFKTLVGKVKFNLEGQTYGECDMRYTLHAHEMDRMARAAFYEHFKGS